MPVTEVRSIIELPPLAESDKCAQPDHSDARRDALIPAQPRARSQPPPQRLGGNYNQQISECIQGDRNDAQNQKLNDDMSESRIDELRQKRQKEQGRLGIQCLSQHALSEYVQRN